FVSTLSVYTCRICPQAIIYTPPADDPLLFCRYPSVFFFLFLVPPTPDIYPLSLHDALPISLSPSLHSLMESASVSTWPRAYSFRSEEHTSELQSRENLVCRLLLEKKNLSLMSLELKNWRRSFRSYTHWSSFNCLAQPKRSEA